MRMKREHGDSRFGGDRLLEKIAEDQCVITAEDSSNVYFAPQGGGAGYGGSFGTLEMYSEDETLLRERTFGTSTSVGFINMDPGTYYARVRTTTEDPDRLFIYSMRGIVPPQSD